MDAGSWESHCSCLLISTVTLTNIVLWTRKDFLQCKSIRKQAEKLTEFMFFCRRWKKSFTIDVNDDLHRISGHLGPDSQNKKNNNNNVMYCQIWWPILEIGALHLTHPSAHTQQWVVNTHPGSNWGLGALLKGTSVMVLKVERVLFIHNSHLQSLPDLRFEPATFGLQVWLSNH